MKTSTRPAPRQPKPPAPPPPRQLSIAFETPVLLGLAVEQRVAAVLTLAALLLQAAGMSPAEDDDVQR